MDDRPSCCSGAGCVISLFIALGIVGYLVYTQQKPVPVVYRAKSAEETINRVEQLQKQEGTNIHRLSPLSPP